MTKLERLKQKWESGDKTGALRIAAKFPRLGVHDESIRRGWNAYKNPETYAEMGQSPVALIEMAFTAMKERFDL